MIHFLRLQQLWLRPIGYEERSNVLFYIVTFLYDANARQN